MGIEPNLQGAVLGKLSGRFCGSSVYQIKFKFSGEGHAMIFYLQGSF